MRKESQAFLGILLAGSLYLAGCPSKNNPSTPAPPAPTATFTSTACVNTLGTPCTSTTTPTNTATNTPSSTPTITFTPTSTATKTSTSTPSSTRTFTFTATTTSTPTSTPTITFTPAPTPPVQTGAVTLNYGPYGIRYSAANGGTLWTTDYLNSRVVELYTSGTGLTVISSFNGGATFDLPEFIGVDPGTANVYVSDSLHNTVEVFNSNVVYFTSVGAAQLGSNLPSGVALNSSGTTFYLADVTNPQIFAYPVTAGLPPTYGTPITFGNSGPGQLSSPDGIACDSHGNLWVADSNQLRVVEYNAAGVYQGAITLFNSGSPADVAVDSSGNVFAAVGVGGIQQYNASGKYVNSFQGSLSSVNGLALDGTSTYLYAADYPSSIVSTFKIH